MAGYTAKEIERAREIDHLTYLRQNDPGNLVHISGGEYCTREHDSLKISNGKWMWWSRGFGGASALDYLIKVKDIPFTEAMKMILKTEAEQPHFSIAPKNGKAKRLHSKENMDEENPQNRSTKEVEAESIAYTVCSHFGLDTADYTFGYVAGWSSGKDTKELRNSLERIRKTADEMITAIDRSMEKQREKGEREVENER